MHVHKLHLYVKEQHSESFDIWSVIIGINTKSLIMQLWTCVILLCIGYNLQYFYFPYYFQTLEYSRNQRIFNGS